MPCYHPLEAWTNRDSTKKQSVLSYNPKTCTTLSPTHQIACKQCIGCRLLKSMEWAARCVHEASLYPQNSFITLTYSDENLPLVPGSDKSTLVKRDFQNFMKRYRKYLHPHKIRNYYCGEYGDQFGRPHYHACIFGHDFPDKKPWRKNDRGDQIWRSAELEKLWKHGNSEIGTLNFDTAAYVARYILKKQNGKLAQRHYSVFDQDTGEIFGSRLPEYTDMSRAGGIGKNWIKKYHTDVYNHDYVILTGGKKMPPPKFYDSQYELIAPFHLDAHKYNRMLRAEQYLDNNTPERLAVREEVQMARQNFLPRKLK